MLQALIVGKCINSEASRNGFLCWVGSINDSATLRISGRNQTFKRSCTDYPLLVGRPRPCRSAEFRSPSLGLSHSSLAAGPLVAAAVREAADAAGAAGGGADGASSSARRGPFAGTALNRTF